MKRNIQRIRLGIFILITSVILVILILFFAADQVFEKSDTYFIAYQDVSVSGLEVGSPVEYLGIRIGSISDISIDKDDINTIVVELSVEPGTPIKDDARADIVTMGITGLKSIEIRGGSNQARSIDRGDFINPGSSTTEEITGKANVIAEKAEKVINNLQIFTDPENLNRFANTADNINRLAQQMNTTVQLLDTLVNENREEIRQTVSSARLVTANLDSSSRKFDRTLAQVNRFLEGDTLQRIFGNAHDISMQIKESELKTLIANLAEMSEQTRVLLFKIDQELDMNSREFNESIQLLRVTLSNLEETSAKINSNPSLLLRSPGNKDIPDQRLDK